MSSHAFQFGLDALQPACTTLPTGGPSAGTLPDIGAPVVANALRVEPDRWQARTRPIGCRLVPRPQRRAALQRCFLRVLPLPYLPCSPSDTRFGAFPRALRLFDVLLRLRRPAGLGFQTKIFRATTARLRSMKDKIFLRTLPESTSRHLGAGTYASLRAVCPEGDPGKYNRRNHHGTLRKQSHSEGLPRQGR
jgi:hypothetical protein